MKPTNYENIHGNGNNLEWLKQFFNKGIKLKDINYLISRLTKKAKKLSNQEYSISERNKT